MLSINAGKMNSIIRMLKAINTEATMHIKDDGVEVKMVDPAHVAMIAMAIQKDAFDEYSTGEPSIGLDIDAWEDMLKLAKKDETMRFGSNDKGLIDIAFGNIKRTMRSVTYDGGPKVPKLDNKTKITLDSYHLTTACKASALITDHILIEATVDSVAISARGDIDTIKYNIPKELLSKYDYDGDAKTLYSLDYFQRIVSVIPQGEITIEYGTDFPAIIKAERDGISVMFLLAPRIEND